ncbi:MAG: IS630 family transposase, partial [Cyanobacteria bacterium QH_6_48_35]
NPVEKVGLQGKNQLRQLAKLSRCFEKMNLLFQLILNHEYFDFPMLSKYGFVQK